LTQIVNNVSFYYEYTVLPNTHVDVSASLTPKEGHENDKKWKNAARKPEG